MILFILILVVNTLLTLAYFLWGYVFHPALKKVGSKENSYPHYDRKSYLFRCIIMFLCPVVGILAFLFGFLAHKVFFRAEVDLANVTFSKERVKTVSKGDEERERNLVPLEEAIAITDKGNTRTLMLNVLRGDIEKSLASISLALNSEDSETAHYAASVLRDELNDFRGTVQKLFDEIKSGGEGMEEYAITLIPYMDNILRQKVFTELEQKNFVLILDQAGEALYQKDKEKMEIHFYEAICMRLLDSKEYDLMEKWCNRLMEEYPMALSAYTCRLKLYFTTHNKEKFFTILQDLKHSNIIIDSETLELIRTFS